MSSLLRSLKCNIPGSPLLISRRSISAKARSSRPPLNLLITFDALGTLIRPQPGVAEQYLDAAKIKGLTVDHIAPSSLFSSFKKSFKQLDGTYPNYGSATHGRIYPREWWSRVVWNTFVPFIRLPPKAIDSPDPFFSSFASPSDLASDEHKDEELHTNVIKIWETCDHLWYHFCGSAYETFLDVWPLLYRLQSMEARNPDILIILGVISNADHRIISALYNLRLFEARAWSRQALASGLAPLPAQPAAPLKFVVTSYSTGAVKPNPLIFSSAMKEAHAIHGLLPRHSTSTIHVGDDCATDVRGALDADWTRVVHLCRNREPKLRSIDRQVPLTNDDSEEKGALAEVNAKGSERRNGDSKKAGRKGWGKARVTEVTSLNELPELVESEIANLRARKRLRDKRKLE